MVFVFSLLHPYFFAHRAPRFSRLLLSACRQGDGIATGNTLRLFFTSGMITTFDIFELRKCWEGYTRKANARVWCASIKHTLSLWC
jgi:hypothetical protein